VAVEETLRARIARDRSDDAVLGEEGGQTGAGARRWIIDGIDGTLDFAGGRPDWGTAGGRFTDLDGHSDVRSGTALFSNGLVHEAVLGRISEV
jgi:hypothetical protein